MRIAWVLQLNPARMLTTAKQDAVLQPASKVCNISTYDRAAELEGISEAHRQYM